MQIRNEIDALRRSLGWALFNNERRDRARLLRQAGDLLRRGEPEGHISSALQAWAQSQDDPKTGRVLLAAADALMPSFGP